MSLRPLSRRLPQRGEADQTGPPSMRIAFEPERRSDFEVIDAGTAADAPLPLYRREGYQTTRARFLGKRFHIKPHARFGSVRLWCGGGAVGSSGANSRQRVKSRVSECGGLGRFGHRIVGLMYLFAPSLQAPGGYVLSCLLPGPRGGGDGLRIREGRARRSAGENAPRAGR